MEEDEQRIFEGLMAAVQGQDVGAASNAALNVVANLIVAVSPSLEQAQLGADYAADQIKSMVPLVWGEIRGASPPER